MSIVQVYIGDNLIYNIREATIRRYSRTIADILGQPNGEARRKVTLSGIAGGPLVYVLDRVNGNKPGKTLHIKVHDMPLKRAIATYLVTELLKIQPAQPHIEGHIVGYISHSIITPEEMLDVHTCFHSIRDKSKTWKVMIHQVAWNMAHQKYAPQDGHAMIVAAHEHVGLWEAIVAKGEELVPKKAQHDERKAKGVKRGGNGKLDANQTFDEAFPPLKKE